MSDLTTEKYEFQRLPNAKGFRVAEILPGAQGSVIECRLHVTEWPEPLEYEAVSYVWGDASQKVPILCDGKRLEITQSLHTAITHLRYTDRPRRLWADVLCIDQDDNPEKSHQISQMKKIYESAQTVLSWLGPDIENKASMATKSVSTISDFLCKQMNISASDLKDMNNITEFVFKHRATLPVPDECEFSSEAMWTNLAWFYSFPYYTRVWVIQEVNANRSRLAHCGDTVVEWDLVELVAGYIIMETDFSKRWGFTKSNVWYAATTTELKRPENWLFMLYLASNYGCLDPRDVIYGLRGLMKFSKGADILFPNYDKSTLEVYRDSVEAALVNFENTDILLYLAGNEVPSWIPAWNVPMLFRNPFRFGNRVPWKPAGETKALWSIDKTQNILSVKGFVVDTIKLSQSYNETYFGNTKINSDEGKAMLPQAWKSILEMISGGVSSSEHLSESTLNAVANAFSYGLNEKSLPAEEIDLLHRFVAYLKIVLDRETFERYIPPKLLEDATASKADGLLFGKPVWDFQYPESSFFITESGLFGCCVSETTIGDIVWVPHGASYPHVLRPADDKFRIRGFAYVYGVMHGEKKETDTQTLSIC